MSSHIEFECQNCRHGNRVEVPSSLKDLLPNATPVILHVLQRGSHTFVIRQTGTGPNAKFEESNDNGLWFSGTNRIHAESLLLYACP